MLSSELQTLLAGDMVLQDINEGFGNHSPLYWRMMNCVRRRTSHSEQNILSSKDNVFITSARRTVMTGTPRMEALSRTIQAASGILGDLASVLNLWIDSPDFYLESR